MDTLSLTFAELRFLLSFQDETRARRAGQRLRLPETNEPDPIASAGMASLAVRGLLHSSGGTIGIAKALSEVAAILTAETTRWLWIATIDVDASDVAQVIDGGERRLIVTHSAPGIYGFVEMDSQLPLADAVTALLESWSETRSGGAFGVAWDDDAGISALLSGGSWHILRAGPEQAEAVSAERAVESIRGYVSQSAHD